MKYDNEENNRKIDKWIKDQENEELTEKEYQKEIRNRNYIMNELITEGHDTCIHEISEKGNIKIEDVIFKITWEAVEMLGLINEINEELNNKEVTAEEKIEYIKQIIK